jgi:hypothetical protein
MPPTPEHFTKADAGAVGTAALAFFKVIPWPEIAAFLAAVYTFLRLLTWGFKSLRTWWRER